MKLVLAVVLSLLFFGLMAENSDVETNFNIALSENKEYAEKMAKFEVLQQAEKKAAYQYAGDKDEFKKILDEYYQVSESLEIEKDKDKSAELKKQFQTLRETMRKELLQSDEYLRLELKSMIVRGEMDLLSNKTMADSTDTRVVKYKEYLGKYIDNSFKQAMKQMQQMPKDDCEGSDEFRAAMHVAKLYKEDPVKYKWPMVHCGAVLISRIDTLAATDPEVKKAEEARDTLSIQSMIYTAALNEKHLDLYRKAELATLASAESRDQETIRNAYEQGEILRKAYERDPEYVRLQEELQNALNHYQQKLDDFIAKSDHPAAIEYRNFSAYIKEEATN